MNATNRHPSFCFPPPDPGSSMTLGSVGAGEAERAVMNAAWPSTVSPPDALASCRRFHLLVHYSMMTTNGQTDGQATLLRNPAVT